jgi:hypothetical protein
MWVVLSSSTPPNFIGSCAGSDVVFSFDESFESLYGFQITGCSPGPDVMSMLASYIPDSPGKDLINGVKMEYGKTLTI